jgi:hypothetical protein
MTLSEKKIELVQSLLLLQDFNALFEIEKLLKKAFQKNKTSNGASFLTEAKTFTNFEDWVAQFEDPDETEDAEDMGGMSTMQFRQRIWAAEQGPDMTLAEFYERVAQS